MPIRHSAWRRADQIILRRFLPLGRALTERPFFACFEIEPRGVRSSAPLDVGRNAAHHHARLFGTISSSRCQRTCRRSICDRGRQDDFHGRIFSRAAYGGDGDNVWWSQTGSNRRPPACKAGALPTELWPRRAGLAPARFRAKAWRAMACLAAAPKERRLVGLGRFELPTSRLSSARSNQLSYKPPVAASSAKGNPPIATRAARARP